MFLSVLFWIKVLLCLVWTKILQPHPSHYVFMLCVFAFMSDRLVQKTCCCEGPGWKIPKRFSVSQYSENQKKLSCKERERKRQNIAAKKSHIVHVTQTSQVQWTRWAEQAMHYHIAEVWKPKTEQRLNFICRFYSNYSIQKMSWCFINVYRVDWCKCTRSHHLPWTYGWFWCLSSHDLMCKLTSWGNGLISHKSCVILVLCCCRCGNLHRNGVQDGSQL